MMKNEHATTEYQSLLDFWFRDVTPSQWFSGGKKLDTPIRKKFGNLAHQATQGALDHWASSPYGRLALIILLDQFSRHIFRGTAQAYAQDARAQQLVLEGIQKGDDQPLLPTERHFFYMPLMHAEDKALQALSVEKFKTLRHEVKGVMTAAQEHRAVIERFGRFPHRNKMLGRVSTPEEVAFLNSGENRFA